MSPVTFDSKAQWLESKIQLALSRQQAITAAFITRFGAEVQRTISTLPLPRTHPRTLEDKIILAETREAVLIGKIIDKYGAVARGVAMEAARKHGVEAGRAASRIIHATGTAAESIFNALRYFLLEGGEVEPLITENSPCRISWTRTVCPYHEFWSDHTADYLYLVQIEGAWVSGFVEGYCYLASHERKIYMNAGPATYKDVITVTRPIEAKRPVREPASRIRVARERPRCRDL